MFIFKTLPLLLRAIIHFCLDSLALEYLKGIFSPCLPPAHDAIRQKAQSGVYISLLTKDVCPYWAAPDSLGGNVMFLAHRRHFINGC